MKIVHIITSLGDGGAQAMLYRLLSNIDRSKYDEIRVISMMDNGIYGDKIECLGIKVDTLNMKRGTPTLSALIKTIKLIKDMDTIQTWMYHADLLGILTKLVFFQKRVIWGIHHSNLDKDKNKSSLIKIVKINVFLSRYTYKIVSCSKYATNIHIKYGYDKDKIVTIPNGIELSKFYFIKDAKQKISREFKLYNYNKIVCHVGRWEKLKDYENLIKAINIINSNRKDVAFLLVGPQIDYNNDELLEIINKNCDYSNNIYLIGRRSDIQNIMSSSDIMVLSSSGEAFPNVVVESMACQTPCVVTNVGDCKYIVDKFGVVVESKNSTALAYGINEMLNLTIKDLNSLGEQCRNRVINKFDINKICLEYEKLYE